MSKFVTNRNCEMCNKIEVGLTEIQIGKSKHFLCYPCMAIFASDVFEFARLNLAKHEDDFGNIYFTDKGEINV